MSAQKEKLNGEYTGRWTCFFRYTDWQGNRKQKFKRGFSSKKEALEYERSFLQKHEESLDMEFSVFVGNYLEDIKPKLKYNTFVTKQNVITTKILPYFKNMKINEIKAAHISKWQNEMLAYRDKNGEPYSPVYLRTISTQLSAIFNYAVRYYDLPKNPVLTAGKMGKKKAKEMKFWTIDEYKTFRKTIDDERMYCAFEILFFTGCRCGELLALTPADFDFEKRTMRINKSYQRIEAQDYITDPKTEKSNRIVSLPQFLCDEVQDFISSLYGIKRNERIFQMTKHALHKAMEVGCEKSGVKKIRLHDTRHSACAYMIEMGFSPVAIAERLGHESIEITYNYAHLYPSKQAEIAEKINDMAEDDEDE